MTTRTTRSMTGLTTSEVIKCLKDGSRDLTQVIYRQIPEMDIFDEDGNLRGMPLYRINYCGDAFCNPVGSEGGVHGNYLHVNHHPEHDHLIWTLGPDQLFRCRVANEYRHWTGRYLGPGHRSFSEGTIYMLIDICSYFDIAVPKGLTGDERVTITRSKSGFGIDAIYLYQEIKDSDGLLNITKAKLKGDIKMVAGVNSAWQKEIATWSTNQETIMRLPQLYLTGLRR